MKYQKILKYRRIPETWENLKTHIWENSEIENPKTWENYP